MNFQDAASLSLDCRYSASANKAVKDSEGDRKLNIFPVQLADYALGVWKSSIRSSGLVLRFVEA